MRRLLVMVPLILAAMVWMLNSRAGAQSDPNLLAQPMLGVADTQKVMMGAAGEDTWAYRMLPEHLGGQLALLRHTDAAGWRIAQRVDAGDPNRGSARVTSGGGGLPWVQGGMQPV